MEEEDELLQFAIQQSLIEAGSEKDEVQFEFSENNFVVRQGIS